MTDRFLFPLTVIVLILLSALAAGFTRAAPEPCARGASSMTFIGGVASVPERTGCE